MASILEKILETKRQEVELLRGSVQYDQLLNRAKNSPQPIGFVSRLLSAPFPAIIAEVKRASPSRGIIRSDLEPVAAATAFQQGGATCLSVLTDQVYFQGNPQFVSAIRAALPTMPILRKDFIIDTAQIWESRLLGADAILLIAAALSRKLMSELALEAGKAGLDILVEVHNSKELSEVVALFDKEFFDQYEGYGNKIILGVNNRDLHAFVVDLNITKEIITELGPDTPFSLIVAESGMNNADDVVRLAGYGAGAFLIGEGLVREGDPGANLKALCQQAQQRLPS